MALTGDINVTIYRGDRRLWDSSPVRLVVLDPFSQTETVVLDHTAPAGAATFLLEGLPADKGQNYSLIATADRHRDAAIYPVKPLAGGVRHTAVMLVRKDPEPDFSHFSFDRLAEHSVAFKEALQKGQIQEEDFLRLEPIRIAAALNIEAKLRNTKILAEPAVNFVKMVRALEEVQQDRIYASVDPNMPGQVRNEAEQNHSFTELAEWANEVFHEGYPVSFKQRVQFGSLQLSFAEKPKTDGLLAADIDIDLYTDIGHFGEVVRNKFTNQATDPFTVYVQLFDQRIFPLYVLKV